MFDIVIGIDPGKTGGIAFIKLLDGEARAIKMPVTEKDIINEMNTLCSMGKAVAYVEKVGTSFPRGRSPSPKAMFTFGKGYGFLRGAVLGASLRLENVHPKTWQKAIGVYYPSGSTDTEKKNITKARAQELFPHIKVTHAIADALLIAEFGKRAEQLEMKFNSQLP